MKRRKLKIIKASHTGFCFGVKRAVGTAENFLKKNKKAYSIGEIIHNPVVVKELSVKGLKVISDIRKAKGSYAVVRSHGISPQIKKRARALSVKLIDATCPFVKRSHAIVTLLKKQGYEIVIIGEKNHPEVKALIEVAGSGSSVVTKIQDLSKLRLRNKKLGVIAQTTLSRDKFFEITDSILQLDCLEYRIFNTICNDVIKRQKEAKELAKKVDAVLVIGGKISANTRHLAQICKHQGVKTHHIETEKELQANWFKKVHSIGVVSGASTPSKIVEDTIKRLKKIS